MTERRAEIGALVFFGIPLAISVVQTLADGRWTEFTDRTLGYLFITSVGLGLPWVAFVTRK